MGFDDRHTEPLILATLLGIGMAVALFVRWAAGMEGWAARSVLIGCPAALVTAAIVLAHAETILNWARNKRRRDP